MFSPGKFHTEGVEATTKHSFLGINLLTRGIWVLPPVFIADIKLLK